MHFVVDGCTKLTERVGRERGASGSSGALAKWRVLLAVGALRQSSINLYDDILQLMIFSVNLRRKDFNCPSFDSVHTPVLQYYFRCFLTEQKRHQQRLEKNRATVLNFIS